MSCVACAGGHAKQRRSESSMSVRLLLPQVFLHFPVLPAPAVLIQMRKKSGATLLYLAVLEIPKYIFFKPIFFFLPEPLHFCIETGISFSSGLKVEPNSDQYEGDPTYGGVGFNLGSSLDYYFPELPIALRLFAVNTIIPQSIPYPELKTGYLSIGLNVVVVLKRHN